MTVMNLRAFLFLFSNFSRNMSASFADEDSAWRVDGLADLSEYANKALLMGQVECYSLQATSSSVDEGEPGKVKLLYDLVYDAPRDGEGPLGLLVEAVRGSSLDVGMLHGDSHDARRRCSVEFWYHLPSVESVHEEIVLARRSVCAPGVDISQLCVPGHKDGILWELVLLVSGELELRTSGGSILSSSESNGEFEPTQSMGDFGDAVDDSNGEGGLVSWTRPDGSGGWNHVCLVFSSRRHQSLTDCTVSMFMKGAKVASTVASIVPPGLESDMPVDSAVLDEVMKKTVYVFGMNAVPTYRITEIRVWSCERSEDDIKFMMYESLRAAETKRKFKVKIRNKRGDVTGGSLLSPPIAPPKDSNRGGKVLVPPPRKRLGSETALSSPKDHAAFAFDASFRAFGGEGESSVPIEEGIKADSETSLQVLDSTPNTLPHTPPSKAYQEVSTKAEDVRKSLQAEVSYKLEPQFVKSPPGASDLHDSNKAGAPLSEKRLSREVRSSAAAALIRGPPATRHFGGNRGGLSRGTPVDRVRTKRYVYIFSDDITSCYLAHILRRRPITGLELEPLLYAEQRKLLCTIMTRPHPGKRILLELLEQLLATRWTMESTCAASWQKTSAW